MPKTGEISGTINVPRSRFNGNGMTGKVEFGRTYSSGLLNRVVLTQVKVTLADGTKATGKYSNPLNVVLRIKEKRRKYSRS